MNLYHSTNFEPLELNKRIKNLKVGDIVLNYKVVDIISEDIREYQTTPNYTIQLNSISAGEIISISTTLNGDDSVSKLLNMNADLIDW